MKKITILMLSIFIFTTGCTVVRINTNSIDNILSVVLSKNNKLYNRVGKGYKYYVPRGVSYIDTSNLNDKLYSNGNYYYLYIDAVSYFYKSKVNYEENNESYYSKLIKGKKEGYLEINKNGNKYDIEFFYNYAKIETTVEKKDIEKVVLDASYILSTVKFNDNIIELMLEDDYFTNKEEKYTKFTQESKIDKNVIEVEN
jgi:hypothetical protein